MAYPELAGDLSADARGSARGSRKPTTGWRSKSIGWSARHLRRGPRRHEEAVCQRSSSTRRSRSCASSPPGARSRSSPTSRAFGKRAQVGGLGSVRCDRSSVRSVNALLIIAGILSAGMGLKGFLFSSHFIDGGVTGISMLLSKTTPVPLALWLPLVNVPFVVLGWRQLGRAFALRSIAGDCRPRGRDRDRALSRRHARSAADGGLRRRLHRRGHRPVGARRRRARRDRDRRAAHRQAQPGPEGRRRHPRLQRRPVPGGDVGAGRRAGALFHPDLHRGGADARLHPARHRGVHGDHHHVGGAAGDPAGDHRRDGAGPSPSTRRPAASRARTARFSTASSRGWRSAACGGSSTRSTPRRSSSSIRWPTCAAASSTVTPCPKACPRGFRPSASQMVCQM